MLTPPVWTAIAGILLICVLVIRGVFAILIVEGTSMYPTLSPGDRLLIIKFFPRRWLKTDRLVVIWPWGGKVPNRAAPLALAPHVKRIIALPGDTVDTINATPGLGGISGVGNSPDREVIRPITVQRNYIYVQADNAQYRSKVPYGEIPVSSVIGLVVGKSIHRALLPSSRADSLFPEFSSLKNGQVAPEFKMTTMEGEMFTLRELRGQWVIIIIVKPNCPPCDRLLSGLVNLKGTFEELGVRPILVWAAHPRETKGIFAAYNLQDLILATPSSDNGFTQQFGGSVVPFYCLIDARGRVATSGPASNKRILQAAMLKGSYASARLPDDT